MHFSYVPERNRVRFSAPLRWTPGSGIQGAAGPSAPDSGLSPNRTPTALQASRRSRIGTRSWYQTEVAAYCRPTSSFQLFPLASKGRFAAFLFSGYTTFSRIVVECFTGSGSSQTTRSYQSQPRRNRNQIIQNLSSPRRKLDDTIRHRKKHTDLGTISLCPS